MMFHGSTGTAQAIANNAQIETFGRYALCVYPNGSDRIGQTQDTSYDGGSWNDNSGEGWPASQGINDLGFFDAIVSQLGTSYKLNGQVFAGGHSKGGFFTYWLAHERQLSAIAVSGATKNDGATSHPPFKPAPLCHFHGEQDINVCWASACNGRDAGITGFNTWLGWSPNSIYKLYPTWDHVFSGCPEHLGQQFWLWWDKWVSRENARPRTIRSTRKRYL